MDNVCTEIEASLEALDVIWLSRCRYISLAGRLPIIGHPIEQERNDLSFYGTVRRLNTFDEPPSQALNIV
jgi:hypothetical protein